MALLPTWTISVAIPASSSSFVTISRAWKVLPFLLGLPLNATVFMPRLLWISVVDLYIYLYLRYDETCMEKGQGRTLLPRRGRKGRGVFLGTTGAGSVVQSDQG
jgi:hypothetical protein